MNKLFKITIKGVGIWTLRPVMGDLDELIVQMSTASNAGKIVGEVVDLDQPMTCIPHTV